MDDEETGGPVEYTGGDMDAVHAPLDIDDEDFEMFAGYLEDTLVEFGVPEQEQQEMLDILEKYREAVVTA